MGDPKQIYKKSNHLLYYKLYTNYNINIKNLKVNICIICN